MDKETREKRQARIERRAEAKHERTQYRNRTRWQLGTVRGGTALLVIVFGAGIVFANCQNQITRSETPIQQTSQREDAQAIILNEIELLGIQQSPKEIALWQRVEGEIAQARRTSTLTAVSKLDIISKAMGESENPLFMDATVFLQQQFERDNLDATMDFRPINRRITNYSPMASGTSITDKFRLAIRPNAESMLEKGFAEIASQHVHEVEHMRNILRTDKPELDDAGRQKIQAARFADKNERITEEARGYMQQARSMIHHLGLTADRNNLLAQLRTNFTEHYYPDLVVKTIKANNNPADSGWKKFMVDEGLVAT